ncbi:DHA1 family tetracycline resistance protein-like MFS transporter [Clostridium saccharoperbutylacetonicum]|uniref:Tetracycline resistance protein, class C n=1 Tax=Clostridium saccharoperbutylacetonicum N1-4(HMT) TaxID=931276 RepID=M1MDY5_9CLOT|nr:tetracycline resistance MFS efflux pump [Clostridium saccharoperbutylacetonicum]AGF56129.1 tetracycline resistance protein, class C [Clostridium saccharoperbutylacetonicum N1-4(HMT)]NRT63130.1 DHA1 family tetracycline resistance protein-like MFS transporter [Clostridium saccharoperbutylacetonicum]NSB26488.1 DHA1 family tetracycline resistance protein-like MFS transporter [Clostridium saccharoperbutylacetonicum]NSB45840.1 DHA1 family tetracycline resistance protein-like MFS transporter [Clost
MDKFKSHKENKIEETVDKHALIFGLISVFLCGIGFSIITPVIPFLVQPYVSNEGEQAIVVTLLMSVYAICVFFAAPALGALSDKYGRRPVLIVCLLGSAIGYLVFGIGGALWILFAGRIIEGVTGGDISTIFAYFGDIIPPEKRTKYFGWMSAVVGVGTVIGPTLGGVLSKFGYSVPMYFGAIITLLNVAYGFFFMPESLDKNNRLKEITFVRLNPFTQLANILSMKNLKRLLVSAFLLWIPNGSFQAVFSQFTMDTFNWKPTLIGLMLSIIGFQDIISQGFIMPKLLIKLNDKQIAILGMLSEIIGYSLIALSTLSSFYPLFIVGMFIFGFGDSIFGPSFNGMLSKSVTSREQGRVQGGSQSIQALARVIGPVIGGQIYVSLGHAAPAFMGMILIAGAISVLYKGTNANM